MQNDISEKNIFQDDAYNVIIAIDLQKQFKDNKGRYEKCIDFIKSHENDCFILGTVFQNYDNSMYEKHLQWSECKDVLYVPTPNGVSDAIEYPCHKLILKTGYGINSDNYFVPALSSIIKIAEIEQQTFQPKIKFHLVGCDADACVLATAFTLWDKHCDFDILTDYIYTTAEDFTLEDVLKIMKRNFGDCVR